MFQSPRVIRSCCRSARNRLQAFLGTSNVCKNPARSLHSANRRSSAVELSNSHHRFHRSVDPTLRRLHHTNTMTDNANTSGAESQQQRTYEQAIDKLNGLIANSRAQNDAGRRNHQDNSGRLDTERFCMRSGLTWPQLDQLGRQAIHVTGTKGKGSTCAITESILRACGVRTGFYSSPHLVRVEERFRIDGLPLQRAKFTEYFWRVYNALDAKKENPTDMPFYFQFLTVMAFHVFIGEHVDCAILEVGIGGEHDCTNVVRTTRTAGIAALGLEHTQMLGDTLAQIAWQKAGIAKRDCTVFSGRQPDECVAVLRERCAERGARLELPVPDWAEYRWDGCDGEMDDGMATNPMYRLNGSLAVQLCYDWMRQNGRYVPSGVGMLTEVSEPMVRGLRECRWPGRFQESRYGNCRLYIDGAHTIESLRVCVDWFHLRTAASGAKKLLLFNVTGNRNARDMLAIINAKVPMHAALFAPNVAYSEPDAIMSSNDASALAAMVDHWTSIRSGGVGNGDSIDGGAKVFASVAEVLTYLNEHYGNDEGVDVLVTGSLYMVGAVSEILEADLNKATN